MRHQVKLAPPWATERLLKFGHNIYGEPHFRVIWGPSRTHIVGGEWGDNGKSEYRRVPRYGLDPKWILERWVRTMHTPEDWMTNFVVGAASKDSPGGTDTMFAIGPYPAQGDYVCVAVFSTEQRGIGGYVPLEPSLVEGMAYAVAIGKVNSVYDIRRNHREQREAKERAQGKQFDAIWADRQHQHKGGLTIGAHARYNQQDEIDSYVRRMEKLISSRFGGKLPTFRKGFKQDLPN